ncbi:MAG: response regulator [Pseudomonadales bacterium]|nr:response regulator [Pseudomonadales bacterium]
MSSDGLIDYANHYARTLGIQTERCLTELVHVDSLSNFENLVVSGNTDIQLVTDIATHHIQISRFSSNCYFIQDLSEKMALSAQLQKNKGPERKFIHDISNALTTTMGYSELINMMLEENESITGNRLATVRRYQSEVLTGFNKADTLIKDHKQGKVVSEAVPIIRRHVMIVDDERSITEFLSELMRARHYKVTAFTSSIAALQFYKENLGGVDLVIMDQIMPEMSGISLATELLACNIDLPIVLCTGDHRLISDQSSGKVRIEHFISKPIDINELTQMVSAIID